MILDTNNKPCRYPSCQCVGNCCVKPSVSGGVLYAVEFAARRTFAIHESELGELLTTVDNDQVAGVFGARLSYIADLCGWTIQRTRRHLEHQAAGGRVIICQSRQGGISYYWLAGLVDELKRERAAASTTTTSGVAT